MILTETGPKSYSLARLLFGWQKWLISCYNVLEKLNNGGFLISFKEIGLVGVAVNWLDGRP